MNVAGKVSVPGGDGELWQTLADNIPQLAWVADADGWIYWYNRRWFAYTGTTLQQMEGWGWKSVHHPDHVERVVEKFSAALASGEAWEDIFPLRSAAGEYRQFLSRAQPLRGSDGQITHWFGTNTDITEQLEAQRQSAFLVRLEDALRSADGPDAARRAAIRLLGRELGASRVTYTETDEQRAEFRIAEQYLAPGVPCEAGVYDGPGYRAVFERYRAGQPMVVRDVHSDERYAEISSDPQLMQIGVRAILDIPLLREGKLASILAVHQSEPRDWTPWEIQLAGLTADRIWSVVERGRAQQALRESEALFRTMAEALPGMLFVTAPDGQNLFVNDFYKSFTGMSDAEVTGYGWRNLIHPDDSAAVDRVVEDAITSGRPFSYQARLRRHDGVWRWHSVEAAPLTDASGGVVRWVGFSLDIHDRATADQTIREAESRYRTIFESAAVGVARVSPEGPFLEVNERYCEILGRSREDILSGDWAEITHPDDLGEDSALVGRVLRGEIDDYTLEKRYLAKDGGDIWVNLTVSCLRDDDGEVVVFIAVAEDIGERKAAEEGLRRSEERYRALFNSMEQGFGVLKVSFDGDVATDYRFIETNPAFERQSGVGQAMLNRSLREALPGLEETWFERYGEIARAGGAHRFVEHAAPLGRSFEVHAFRIGDPAEHTVAVLFTDVTERIQREQALRQSEQDFRLRLNAIPQMVWSTLPDGYHDFYNDRWYEFTGVPAGSTDGEGWNDMFHRDDQDRAWGLWRHSLATGEPYEIEYRLRHRSGEYRWVLGRALPVRDESGRIVRWMGTCTDIADYKAAEQALADSEARLRAVIEAAPVGLVFADAAGGITGGNARVEQMIGHPVLPSKSIEEYREWIAFHSDGRQVEGHEYPLGKVLAGHDTAEMEVQYQRGDGQLRWIRFSAASMKDGDGKLLGGVVASIDIDREKRLTESLEREVEMAIEEREAAQEALRQSQKLEAMGQLTGGVAHDFNNLLTPIIGSLDLIQRKKIADARTQRLIDGALQSAERAKVLVQRLLAFARRQPLQPTAVDVGKVVTEMAELVASTSGPRVKMDLMVQPDLPPAMADGNQLEMALLNLSVNARDAMPEGGNLTIAARREEAAAGNPHGLRAGGYVVLSVTDNGAGMDEATQRRAIEPFFSTKGVGKGTGLGLSMVHGLAAQLGGALRISSRPGLGTSIELWLPVASGEVSAQRTTPTEEVPKGAGVALLVDDEDLVRVSTASMLSDLGYDVTEAASAEEALQLLQNGLQPAVLVSDHLMPGRSGTDLALQVRERWPKLPVLIVSGYADVEGLTGSLPYLTKPFRQAELAHSLSELLAVTR